ncbi:MAG TPA: hypothetical protein VFW13_07035, partial [Phenylobacterium sp.]|nr:hypothetical protein [Phenylobacterium sp.]
LPEGRAGDVATWLALERVLIGMGLAMVAAAPDSLAMAAKIRDGASGRFNGADPQMGAMISAATEQILSLFDLAAAQG